MNSAFLDPLGNFLTMTLKMNEIDESTKKILFKDFFEKFKENSYQFGEARKRKSILAKKRPVKKKVLYLI